MIKPKTELWKGNQLKPHLTPQNKRMIQDSGGFRGKEGKKGEEGGEGGGERKKKKKKKKKGGKKK
jgi:hypothetical protein